MEVNINKDNSDDGAEKGSSGVEEVTLSQEEPELIDVELLPDFSKKMSFIETGSSISCDNNSEAIVKNSDQSLQDEHNLQPNEMDESGGHDNVLVRNVPSSAVKASPAGYKCNCGEFFVKSTELAAHKRWTCRLAEKKFQCSICMAWFAHKHSLKRHMKHSHVHEYRCTQCHLRFHNRIKLTRHWMEAHYEDSQGKNKLKCFLCGADSFKRKVDLEDHVLIHKFNMKKFRRFSKGKDKNPAYIDLMRPVLVCTKPLSNLTDNNSKSEMISSTTLSNKAKQPSQSCTSQSISDSEMTTSTLPLKQPLQPGGLTCQTHCVYSSHRCQQQKTCNACNPDKSTIKCSCGPSSLPTETDDQRPRSSSPEPQPLPSSTRLFPMYPSHTHPHPPHHSYTFPPHHSYTFPPHHFYPPLPPHHHSHPPPHHSHPPPPHHSHPPPPHHHSHPPPPPDASGVSNPSCWPPLHLDPPFKRHCKSKHENRWRWKNYFKNMMCQNFPPPWTYGYYPGSAIPESITPLNQHSHPTSHDASVSNTHTPSQSHQREQNSEFFKMACTFCSAVLEKGKADQHRLRECPFASAFKCKVCKKTFKNHHRLLKHMSHQGHFLNETNATTTAASNSSDISSVSNLLEKLNSVLDFQNKVKSTAQSAGHSKNSESEHVPIPAKSYEHHDICKPNANYSMSGSALSNLTSAVNTDSREGKALSNSAKMDNMSDSGMDETSLLIGKDCSSAPALYQCQVCHEKFDSTSVFCTHLQAHITHVTAVQKVHAWKEKTFRYLSDNDKMDSPGSSCLDLSTDIVSVTTTDSCFQDGSSSANFSTRGTVENMSEKEITVTDSDKWLKPHCKKKREKRDQTKSYLCEFCDERFAFKKSLSFHMKEIHSDKSKNLECPVCHKKFNWKNRGQFYERHLSSHYGVTIFKHKCEICDKTFLEKCKLQAHMARHKAELLHKCQICGKGYGTKSSLTRHLRQHTGDKPHHCTLCSESFLEKRELIRHISTHTGVPAFECVECNQGFTLKTSMDIHMKRKHGIFS